MKFHRIFNLIEISLVGQAPGDHIVNNLFLIAIQIQWKFHFAPL